MKALHDGHRNRLREKFRKDALEEHEFLELLLCYGIPRKNTNEIAHRLLERFGSLYGVLNADERLLREVPGMGEQSALYLKVIAESVARYRRSQAPKSALLNDTDALELYLTSLFIGSQAEKVYALFFGANGRLLACECIAEGFASGISFPVGELLRLTSATGACTVILAHNHPNGSSAPSNTDLLSTERLEATLSQVGVKLRDHVIVADDQCQSIFAYRKQKEALAKSKP